MVDDVGRITSKIIEDARKKSDETLGEAKREGSAKIEAAKKKGESTKDRFIKEARGTADQMRKKIVAESKIKARTILLESKEKLIQEAFLKAGEHLEKLSLDKKYSEVLIGLAVGSGIKMGGGELEIIVRKEDEKTVAKELKRIEKDIKEATGKPSAIHLSTEDMGPGAIVRRADGKVGIDSTIRNRLELLRTELRLKVAEALFT